MGRVFACVLMAALTLPFVLTTSVIVRFHLERERIVREVCVQRAVSEAKRTCHGQCHLKKQLDAEERAASDVPASLRVELRIETAITHDRYEVPVGPSAGERSFGPACAAALVEGFVPFADPVPWG